MLAFAAACASLGALIAVGMVALCGGYIAASAVMTRFSRTVLGTHVRHFFSRIAPAKRFDLADRSYIEGIIYDAIKEGRLIEVLRG